MIYRTHTEGGCVHSVFRILVISVLLDITSMYLDGYDCPASSHRKFRQSLVCKNSSVERYSCLFDERNKIYKESCTEEPDFVRRGHKYVLKGARDAAACYHKRFQPFIFWSNESSQCAFLKDRCSELGQIVINNGSSWSDRLCRCDYTKGFSFVTEPQQRCYCLPSQEDCTCMVKSCSTHEVLSPDYECIQKNLPKNRFSCDHLVETVNKNETTPKRSKLSKDKIKGHGTTCRIIITALVAVIGVAMIVVFLVYSLHTRNLNILRIHRTFLEEEMNTEKMKKALRLGFVGIDGDRASTAKIIYTYLEKKFYNLENIDQLLEIFENNEMGYISRRLDNTRKIFSCTADAPTLLQYIMRRKSWIISILNERGSEFLKILQERNIISANDITKIAKPDFNEIISEKIIEKGRFAILTLFDALCILNENVENIEPVDPMIDANVDSTLTIISNIMMRHGYSQF